MLSHWIRSRQYGCADCSRQEGSNSLRIKEVAKEHGVHIVENKPLAQTLYSAVETGSQIPVELYKAVAVLAYVYQMNRKR